jgi:hypothetical protein
MLGHPQFSSSHFHVLRNTESKLHVDFLLIRYWPCTKHGDKNIEINLFQPLGTDFVHHHTDFDHFFKVKNKQGNYTIPEHRKLFIELKGVKFKHKSFLCEYPIIFMDFQ